MADYQEELRELIKKGEGSIDHMYLDTVGKVTVGVGNMLPNAAAAEALPFVVRDSGAQASAGQIAADFDAVSAAEPGKVASSYKSATRLSLPEAEIDALLDRRLAGFEDGLVRDFPDYPAYPAPARMALMDMAFNLGNQGLVSKFPSLTRAAKQQDWMECAAQCRRRGIADSRNQETHDLFVQAAG